MHSPNSPTTSDISYTIPHPVQVLDYTYDATELKGIGKPKDVADSDRTVTRVSPHPRRVPNVPKPDQEKEIDWDAENEVLLNKKRERRQQAALDLARSWDTWFKELEERDERAKKRAKKLGGI